MFDLPHMILFSILAIASGADSYRKMGIFIKENFEILQKHFGTKWKRAPSYNSIRHAISKLDQKEIEKIFRKYSKEIAKLEKENLNVVSLDGKALRRSFDNVADKKFKQILSVFSVKNNIILAHEKIGISKENISKRNRSQFNE